MSSFDLNFFPNLNFLHSAAEDSDCYQRMCHSWNVIAFCVPSFSWFEFLTISPMKNCDVVCRWIARNVLYTEGPSLGNSNDPEIIVGYCVA